MKGKTFVISLGGSLVAPKEGIDSIFLKNFKNLILKQTKRGDKFFLVVGGGATARRYIEAIEDAQKTSQQDLDWLGIHATRLNAYLVKTFFKNDSYGEIIKDPTADIKTNKKIILSGGWKPGWSTDYVATKIAEKQKALIIINLSNIDFAYDKNPKKFKDAKKITEINWKNFRKIVGNKWRPGMSTPFDPIASRLAQKLGLTVIIANGKNLKNLKNILNGKKYQGTTINNKRNSD